MPEIHWNSKLYNEQHYFVSDYGANVLKWIDQFAQHAFINLNEEEAKAVTTLAVELLNPF